MKLLHVVLLCYLGSASQLIAADIYRIYLRDFSLAINEFDYYVEEVIDVRDVDNYIGFVRKGLGDRKVPAMLGERSAEEELKALFARSFPAGNEKTPLIVRVNKFLVYEVVYAAKAYAFAEVNLSFLTRTGDVYLELYETGTMITKPGLEVTGSHEKNIIQALDHCFKQFRAYATAGAMQAMTVPANELRVNPIGKRHYPIETATEYPKGVYHTLADFRNNTPDASVEFTINYKKQKKEETLEAVLDFKDPKVNVDEIWGFSDGKQIFINAQGSFHVLQKEEDNFVVQAPSLSKGVGSAVVGGILGGAIGGLLMSAFDHSSGKEMTYKIDYTTGAVTPLKEPGYKRIEASSAIYFTSFAKDGSELTVFVNGEEKCTLNPGQYYMVRTKPARTSVEICIAANGEKACQQIEPELLKTEAYLCRIEKKGAPVIESPSTGTLQSVQEKIREGKATEACAN